MQALLVIKHFLSIYYSRGGLGQRNANVHIKLRFSHEMTSYWQILHIITGPKRKGFGPPASEGGPPSGGPAAEGRPKAAEGGRGLPAAEGKMSKFATRITSSTVSHISVNGLDR